MVSGKVGDGPATLGTFTWKAPGNKKGVVTIKMTNSTSTTSVNGTMLISATNFVCGLNLLCIEPLIRKLFKLGLLRHNHPPIWRVFLAMKAGLISKSLV